MSTCYFDAYWRCVTSRGALVLCQGYPVCTMAPWVGERFGHAWCEIDDRFVLDFNRADGAHREVVMPRDLYYEHGKIEPQYVQRYTAEQARSLFREQGYGHWTEEPPYPRVRWANYLWEDGEWKELNGGDERRATPGPVREVLRDTKRRKHRPRRKARTLRTLRARSDT